MIAACPKCQTRYRLKPEQLGERGIRLRCRRCEALFRVLPPPSAPGQAVDAVGNAPPVQAASPAAAQALPEATRAAPPAPQKTEPSPQPVASPSSGAQPALLVCLRDDEEAKRLADRFCMDGQTAVAVADGAEALLALHRCPPKVAILDASLSALGGHSVCEIIKRSPLLQEVRVLMRQGPDSPSREAAAEGFGADLYLDTQRGEDEVEAALARALAGWDLQVPPESDAVPSNVVAPAPPAVSTPTAPIPGEHGEEVERAERLARIAVSDIVLYNEEKFSAALRSSDPLATMRDEVEEGRALLRGRIAEVVYTQRDFVGDELLRLVRERA